MEESLDQNNQDQPATRPVFLTVICILTFVGVGLGVIFNLWTYAFVHSTGISRFGGGDIERYAIISVAIAVLGNLICLLGALMMWNLKKMGYYIYIGGHLSVIIMKLTVESKFYDYTTPMGMMNFFVFALMIPIAFVIMYGVNLKAMVK